MDDIELTIKSAKQLIEEKKYKNAIDEISKLGEIENETVYWIYYYCYWYIDEKEKSKEYFNKCLLLYRIDNQIDRFLYDYRFYYYLPKISILDIWYRYDYGKYVDCLDIYPENLIEVISNINEMTGDFVISGNKLRNPKDIMVNYLNKINGHKSFLFTKDEYIENYLNENYLSVAIRNFKRNDDCNLVAMSVKHFNPSARIYLFNFYEEGKVVNLDDIKKELFYDIIDIPTKYLLGNAFFNRNNGLYYTESFNHIYHYFETFNGKLLILDENYYLSRSEEMGEILANDFDIAWAEYFAGIRLNRKKIECQNPVGSGYVSASILCINPIKVKKLFPLPEIREYIETILTDNLMNTDLKKYYLKYSKNQSEYTNNSEKMRENLKKIEAI